eukprot:scaffold14151_cov103-Isochrysis_galbana.AAC.3
MMSLTCAAVLSNSAHDRLWIAEFLPPISRSGYQSVSADNRASTPTSPVASHSRCAAAMPPPTTTRSTHSAGAHDSRRRAPDDAPPSRRLLGSCGADCSTAAARGGRLEAQVGSGPLDVRASAAAALAAASTAAPVGAKVSGAACRRDEALPAWPAPGNGRPSHSGGDRTSRIRPAVKSAQPATISSAVLHTASRREQLVRPDVGDPMLAGTTGARK